jgi:uncharacterized protein YutE (UPF0331/DUF86 family)
MPVDEDVLKTRISDVRLAAKELQRLASKPFVELNVDEKYSMRYNVVVLVESLVSLCVHIATEAYDQRPMSYKEAVRIVAEKLNLRCIEDLESLVSLRNLLIHRYWIVNDKKIYEGVKTNFKCVNRY